MNLRILDLFSGIGGFSLGLERAGGFETVAFCEVDPEAQKVLAARFPGVPIYNDVQELGADRLRADGIRPNAIVGGFPCQDISNAGRGEGLAGARSGLWREFARLVGELRPELVLVENVAALLGRGIDRVLGDLAALGYDAEWHCIPASYAGARQLRDRVWIVAYPQCDSVQGRSTITQAWCAEPRAKQLAGLVQPCAWPTVSCARDRGTGHGVPRGIHRNKQLGNAVNPQLIELIGNAILAALFEKPARRSLDATASAAERLSPVADGGATLSPPRSQAGRADDCAGKGSLLPPVLPGAFVSPVHALGVPQQ